MCSLSIIGYQGDKCDSPIVSTTAPTTTIAPVTKCTDCVTAGTAYCSFVNGQFSCSCKSGATEYFKQLKQVYAYHEEFC